MRQKPSRGSFGGPSKQYWRSFEQLEHYARDSSLQHLPAWHAFNKAVGADGSVGIWHETYLVQANQFECVYGNMPRMGLAAAGSHVPATGRRETAKRRLGMQDVLFFVAFVDRESTRRIISLRRANRREVSHYVKAIKED